MGESQLGLAQVQAHLVAVDEAERLVQRPAVLAGVQAYAGEALLLVSGDYGFHDLLGNAVPAVFRFGVDVENHRLLIV